MTPQTESLSSPLESLPKLSLYNSLSRSLAPFEPLEPPKVKFYCCGPTVYDWAHLGHARCYITWDVLARVLRFWGFDLTYVRNVTDVDDKILNRSKEENRSPSEVAELNYERFQQDMTALNVLPVDEEPRATHYIDSMHRMIEKLVEQDYAYRVENGTVYFRALKKADYGKLSGKNLDELKAGARVEVETLKEHPFDFALWKGVPDSESYAWESPWGRGRPGWHIECSSMIQSILGDQIDIHAGGSDLTFPHHENEIAQSEACTHKSPMVKYWLHNGMVNVDGVKMSKSLGNFSTIQDMLAHYDSNTIRYFLLQHHYRMGVDFTQEGLDGAKNRVVKLERNLKEIMQSLSISETEVESASSNPPLSAEALYSEVPGFMEALARDMNTPQALASLNQQLKQLNRTQDATEQRKGLNRLLTMMTLLGFILPKPVSPSARETSSSSVWFQSEERPGPELLPALNQLAERLQLSANTELSSEQIVCTLAEARLEAKQAKQWAQADALREGLQSLGFQLMDAAGGKTSIEFSPLSSSSATGPSS